MSWEKNRKQQKGKTNDARDWAGLHDDLLEEVMKRLPLADCLLSSGGVCRPWRSASFRYLDNCDRRVPFEVKNWGKRIQVTSRISIFRNLNLRMDFPEPRPTCVMGSFQDWLFLGRRDNNCLHISLLNPFSGENIVLPTTRKNYYLMVLYKVPSDEKCVFMLIGEGAGIAFWTPGAPDWHHTRILTYRISDALYYRGCFYLLSGWEKIFYVKEEQIISEINTGSKFFDAKGVSSIHSFSLNLPIPLKYKYGLLCTRRYLVESCGEILLVCRIFCEPKGLPPPRLEKIMRTKKCTSDFETYRLDLNKMAALMLEKWDDQVLFLGAGCSKSFHVNDLGGTLPSNIYFIDESSFSRFRKWNRPFKPGIIDGDDSDDSDHFSYKKLNWPSILKARAKTIPGIWLSAPIGWSLQQRRIVH